MKTVWKSQIDPEDYIESGHCRHGSDGLNFPVMDSGLSTLLPSIMNPSMVRIPGRPIAGRFQPGGRVSAIRVIVNRLTCLLQLSQVPLRPFECPGRELLQYLQFSAFCISDSS